MTPPQGESHPPQPKESMGHLGPDPSVQLAVDLEGPVLVYQLLQ